MRWFHAKPRVDCHCDKVPAWKVPAWKVPTWKIPIKQTESLLRCGAQPPSTPALEREKFALLYPITKNILIAFTGALTTQDESKHHFISDEIDLIIRYVNKTWRRQVALAIPFNRDIASLPE